MPQGRCSEPFYARLLIDALRQLPVSDAATVAVLDVYDLPETDRCVRVAALHYLLHNTHADRYFADLRRESLTPRKAPNQYDDPPSAATGALLVIGAEDQGRRPQVTETVRLLLERILMNSHPTWSQLEQLVSYLGSYGGPGDVALLSKYCEQSSVRVEAAYALAQIEPAAALEAARRHVASQIATQRGKPVSQYSTRYWNEVNNYSDLFVAFGDRRVIESYEEFLKHLAAHSQPGYELTYYQERITSMLKVLLAKDAHDELECAIEYVRTQGPRFPSYGDDFVPEKLAERLAVAAGTKEEAQRRLQQARQAWRDRANLSWGDVD